MPSQVTSCSSTMSSRPSRSKRGIVTIVAPQRAPCRGSSSARKPRGRVRNGRMLTSTSSSVIGVRGQGLLDVCDQVAVGQHHALLSGPRPRWSRAGSPGPRPGRSRRPSGVAPSSPMLVTTSTLDHLLRLRVLELLADLVLGQQRVDRRHHRAGTQDPVVQPIAQSALLPPIRATTSPLPIPSACSPAATRSTAADSSA